VTFRLEMKSVFLAYFTSANKDLFSLLEFKSIYLLFLLATEK